MGQLPHDPDACSPYVDRMREFHGTATAFVDATPESVFDFITNIDRLPDWNASIETVVVAPESLSYGSQWVVVMHSSGLPHGRYRSQVEAINRDALRFAYRSTTDDGNSDYVYWSWQIVAVDGGTQVTVMWDGHSTSFWRRAPFFRRPQLSKEVPASLESIRQHVSRRSVI
jgi:uncharacterized protein YndB with AHSA1/START domain